MDEKEERDGLRGTEVGEELAIGKREHRMTDEERKLARELRELEQAEDGVKTKIAEELRREHWGLEPERPFRRPEEGGK
jgi:hypothetical protein